MGASTRLTELATRFFQNRKSLSPDELVEMRGRLKEELDAVGKLPQSLSWGGRLRTTPEIEMQRAWIIAPAVDAPWPFLWEIPDWEYVAGELEKFDRHEMVVWWKAREKYIQSDRVAWYAFLESVFAAEPQLMASDKQPFKAGYSRLLEPRPDKIEIPNQADWFQGIKDRFDLAHKSLEALENGQ